MNEWAAVQEQSWGTGRWILYTPGLPLGFGESESQGSECGSTAPSSTTSTFPHLKRGAGDSPSLPGSTDTGHVSCAASQAILGAGGAAGSPRQVGPG